MKMLQVQGGLGFGVNQNRLIFVFANEPALRNFINQGWEFGGQVNLSAMAGGQGGMFSGAAAVCARRVPLPTDADRPCGNAHGRRHEVLQGRRPELKRSLRWPGHQPNST